ncbi:glycosyltransferase family 2 protein [uncultured Winogradskyella sp.]|uniref:glycosyltransferase family 2 protein n=1 Tax=uncultured Winogradskyella sp. TaxID=395353 RepID=UPI00263288D6|nr:glycosyltransferase family 2 protein [uncultured Winogradskyella sp.]
MDLLVSVITPMFNNEAVIVDTVNSVRQQTYPHWELILIDDASTDHTNIIIQSLLEQDTRIQLYKHLKNKGTSEARNLGTKMAKGDVIAFLDADDKWHKYKLELQLKALKSADVCFGSYELIDENSKPLNKKVNALNTLSYKKLLRANYIGNLTGVYNVNTIGKIYTKDLKKRQDWLLWLEALRRSKKPAIGLQETIAYYRISKGSLSSNKTNLIKHNFYAYRKGLGYSYLKSIVYMVLFLFEHLIIKRRLIRSIP